MVFAGYNVGAVLKRTFKETMDDNVLGLAAETAYYFFFSLFPLFLFAAPLLGLLGNKEQTLAFAMQQLQSIVPADAFAMVRDVLDDVLYSKNAPGVASIGALLAIWAGSNIFSSLMSALNAAYDVKESRPWWKQKLIACACVIGAGIVLLMATLVMLAGEDIVKGLAGFLHIGSRAASIWTILQFPMAIAMLVGLAWTIFYVLPNVRQNKRHVLMGALLNTALFIAVTLIFRAYVQHFANYNKTYGTIGGVIVLLTWMYLSMLTVLIGGELASELHHGTGALDPRKGATIGGRVATAGGRASTEQVSPSAPLG
jgi:membrane protein